MKRVAVIDLGSNSVRLVIFEVLPKGFRVLDDMKESVRLEEGLDDSQNLSEASMNKAILTLRMFQSVCFAYGAFIIAVATAAMRKANNRTELMKRIEKETGIKIRLISGEEEAYFDYLGVINSIEVTDGVIMDIGGGSTELILFEGKKIKEAVSLPFGSIDLTKRFKLAEPVQPEYENSLNSFLQNAFKNIPWIEKEIKGPLIGVGGIIRNIGKIDRRRKAYPIDIAHNYEVALGDICEIYHAVKNLPTKDRSMIDGLSSDRADIFVGANAAVKVFMESTGIKKLITSGYGLREGLVFHYQYNLPRGQTSVLDSSLENIMRIYQVDSRHGNHVYMLYSKLYSALKDVHLIQEDLTRVNKAAALLHDIGINVRFYDHHEHTFYLILNTGLNGLSHRELVLSAHIAASHRIKKFKLSLDEYRNMLNKGDKMLARKAGVILQIANSFDRSLDGKVKNLHCQVNKNSVIIRLESNNNNELEKKDALCAAENFKKVFRKELIIM
ncbi:MAG: Exopolyphosphatase [Candidatus Dichloromethanomonas elyunquensis]|nr:MAG: Exopolyphosphatase [Candidatus Dichloromethanomonas elyunquensis]